MGSLPSTNKYALSSSILTHTHIHNILLDSSCPATAIPFFGSLYIKTEIFCTLFPVPLHSLSYIHFIQNFTATILFVLVKLMVTFMLLYRVVNYHLNSQHLLMQLITSSLIGFLHLVLRTSLFKFSFCVIGCFFTVLFAGSSSSSWPLNVRMPPYLSLKSSAVLSLPWAPGYHIRYQGFKCHL